jgi:beta-1,4-mannosyltransferase
MTPAFSMPRFRVTVVVLGDLGRSPRMLYHARALADSGADVQLVGYEETELPPETATNPRVTVHVLQAPAVARRHALSRPVFLLVASWNAVRAAASLLATLSATVQPGSAILVQNPPTIPALAVALAVARIRRARLVIDWHNLGWAMLALRLGARHPVVRLVRAVERLLGRGADAHLCVSRALAAELERWGIGLATVFRDRPGVAFLPLPAGDRRQAKSELASRLRLPGLADGSTALLVSPTSWTADEDFELLMDAAVRWDQRVGPTRPPLAVVVTGEGPRRAEFERRFAARPLRFVSLRTTWLATGEYQRFLGAADLGLCLHRSASGLDLPMKVADLFGTGVPVVAFDYGPCLAEIAREGDNALLFRTADELVECLRRALAGFPDHATLLDRLRAGVARDTEERWGDAWPAAARPVLVPGVTG